MTMQNRWKTVETVWLTSLHCEVKRFRKMSIKIYIPTFETNSNPFSGYRTQLVVMFKPNMGVWNNWTCCKSEYVFRDSKHRQLKLHSVYIYFHLRDNLLGNNSCSVVLYRIFGSVQKLVVISNHFWLLFGV